MRRRVSIAALCFAWLCANGVVWNGVQVVAWVKMVHDYSQVMPLRQAVKVVLSGEAPCDVCNFVDAAQDSARDLPREAALGATDRFVLSFHATAPIVLTPPDSAWPPIASVAGRVRREAVPLPPPRIC